MRTWIIGSGAGCDLVVARPTVSGRHCRLTEVPGGYLLEDLAASQGTYVNGRRITTPTRVSTSDVITLGTTVRMPWPATGTTPETRIVRIGRSADNDIVIDDPRVSSHHARLIVSGSQTLIQDVGSSSGTFVNSPDHDATLASPITAKDVVFLGSLAVPASRLLTIPTQQTATAPPPPSLPSPAAPANVIPRQEKSPAPPPTSQKPEPVVSPAPASPAPAPSRQAAVRRNSRTLGSPVHTPGRLDGWKLILLAQPLIIAVLIALLFGRQAAALVTATHSDSAGWSIAATNFALGSAAIWLGGSLAVWNAAGRPSARHRDGSIAARLRNSAGVRLVGFGALCIAQCAVLLAIVHRASGLRGDWLWMFGTLVLVSGVALSFGLVVTGLVRFLPAAFGVLFLSFLVMVALGGWAWPIPELSPTARIAAATMPSRWAFEGLLLLEPPLDPSPVKSGALQPAPQRDLAEDYFPAESERMGPEADGIALAAMLISLSSLAALISARPKPAA